MTSECVRGSKPNVMGLVMSVAHGMNGALIRE